TAHRTGTIWIHRRQLISSRQRNNGLSVHPRINRRWYVYSSIRLLSERSDNAFELLVMFGIDRGELQLQPSCQLIVFTQLLKPPGVAPASNNEYPRDIGNELLQEFQSFSGECFIRIC